MKRFFIMFCALIIVAHVLLYIFQRHLTYSPPRHTPQLKEFNATDMEVVTIHTKDGLNLFSWYKPSKENHPTVLYVHGNAGHIGGRIELARDFMDAGFGVFLLEYRGYAGNPGTPSEEGLYEDARTALRFLKQKGIEPQHIVMYGESIGTGVASKMASENPFCAVILQSPYTSLLDLARYKYPWILIKPREEFNSFDRIKDIHSPILIIHGTADAIVPFAQGLKMFQGANEPKEFLQLDYYKHNDLWDSPGFSDKVVHFIEKRCMNHS